MTYVEKLEDCIKSWKASKKSWQETSTEESVMQAEWMIKGLKLALKFAKEPSNTRMQIDALKCGICGKKTALVCTQCAKDYIVVGHD